MFCLSSPPDGRNGGFGGGGPLLPLKRKNLLPFKSIFYFTYKKFFVQKSLLFIQKFVCLPPQTAVTEASVEEDRKLYIQATIVRVMKSRKTINHAELMSEVGIIFIITIFPIEAYSSSGHIKILYYL